MASVSNQNFEEVELLAWQAVLEAAGLPPISAARVREKQKALDSASNYSYAPRRAPRPHCPFALNARPRSSCTVASHPLTSSLRRVGIPKPT